MFNFGKQKKMADTPAWDSKYFSEYKKSDWDNLKPEKITYMIEESRLYLQNIFESTNCLAQKASFILTLIGGLIGYIFVEFLMNYKQYKVDDWYIWPIAGYFVVLVCSFFGLRKYLLPSIDYDAVGIPPENLLLKTGMMDLDFPNIAITQLELYQGRINNNRTQNTKMAQAIKRCLVWIILYPILATTTLFICFLLAVWN